MEGWVFLNSSSKMGELPRITEKNFAKHMQSICRILGVTEMWESLKQGLTAPETALDGCFSHSASVYRMPFKCVEASWWWGGARALGALGPRLHLS